MHWMFIKFISPQIKSRQISQIKIRYIKQIDTSSTMKNLMFEHQVQKKGLKKIIEPDLIDLKWYSLITCSNPILTEFSFGGACWFIKVQRVQDMFVTCSSLLYVEGKLLLSELKWLNLWVVALTLASGSFQEHKPYTNAHYLPGS